jgi:AcrR family transcriptional regulator
MIDETRARLVAAGRKAFATKGFAAASMDDLTADVGLTRGALHHHFKDKRGLFEAVTRQIDEEMAIRLNEAARSATSAWDAFVCESVTYLELALDPEIQRIIHLDGPAVLGDPSLWASAEGCVATIRASLEQLQAEKVIVNVDAEAMARLISGASTNAAQWIANAGDPTSVAERATAALEALLARLLRSAKDVSSGTTLGT